MADPKHLACLWHLYQSLLGKSKVYNYRVSDDFIEVRVSPMLKQKFGWVCYYKDGRWAWRFDSWDYENGC